MRKLTTSVVGIVLLGLALNLVTGRKTDAAPGGFSVADFKGVYVGHYTGRSVLGTSSGIIRLSSNGAGSVNLFRFSMDGNVSIEEDTYTVDSDGQVQIVPWFRGYLSDRGKTLDFAFDETLLFNESGAGTVTIQ